jgi:12,18-didecarboxysiroheme deacetylase
MIGISKLWCGTVEPSDALRYGRKAKDLPSHLLQFSKDKKPVVVWNCTRRCNLNCVHCYSQSKDQQYKDELTTAQGKAMIDDLAAYGAPVLLFSGGEPLLRKDLFELIEYAISKGMRAVISTNGTLIDEPTAKKLKTLGLSYVGISLDGIGVANDEFRGKKGAFDRAMAGIDNCMAAGLKVGLRFTINKRNADQVEPIFDLIEEKGIPRVCFYHLVYTGRGKELIKEDLNHEETRHTVDVIIDRTAKLHKEGRLTEVLTVDNHADGIHLYNRLKKENPERAKDVLTLLQFNEGNSTGRGIGCVSWDGEVHPDQFWRNHSLGNVRDKPFSEIWTDESNEFLMKLKDKRPHLTGRCKDCRWIDVCGGNFRARAEAMDGDPWTDDPACFLTDEEIAPE